jgi:uncharacterized membrane protein (DUF2068 family)
MQFKTEAERHQHRHLEVLRAVASLELFKGLAALLAGSIVLALIHKDTWDIADGLLRFFHINEDRHFAQVFLDWADDLTPNKLWAVAAIAGAYASLRFVEAYGLWKARVWGEWIALISGAVYLPLEIYELIRKSNGFHVTLLVINLAVVGYMIYSRMYARSHRYAPEVIESTQQ